MRIVTNRHKTYNTSPGSLFRPHIIKEPGYEANETPRGLLRAFFFYNGLNFVLCGGEEHRSLKVLQLRFSTVPDSENPQQTADCVKYTKQGSKNRPGEWHQLNLENKTVV